MSVVATHQTALCLIPPENVWEQIQLIRSNYDKAYPRWMPHINLIYPFVPESEFQNLKSQLDTILNKKNSFEIEFDQSSFQYFKQKGNECTFHLRPKQSKDVVELQQIIQNFLPNYITNTRTFEAHLTLGQTTTSRISDILIEIKAKWKPIKFTIDRVCLISRENDPKNLFSIKNQVILAGGLNNNPHDQLDIPIENLTIVERPTTIKDHVTSKYSLCIIPPMEFSSRILYLFEETSFRPCQPFRILLVEYDKYPNESELRLQIESISKFMINFNSRSICFNYSTTRLFLKPINIELIKQLNLKNNQDFDGTLTLGELDKNELTSVGNRFTDNWTVGINEFEVDRVHLIDANGRFRCSFSLKSQAFS